MNYNASPMGKETLHYYLSLPPKALAMLPVSVKASIAAAIPRQAKGEIAAQQINKLLGEIHQKIPKDLQYLIPCAVGVVGIFLFSSAAQVATFFLPDMIRTQATVLLAAAMAVLGENRIKHLITFSRLKARTTKTIAQLKDQKKATLNDLRREYQQEKIFLVNHVQSVKFPWADGLIALGLIFLEVSSCFYLAWDEGILYAFFSATIPTAIILACASLLSEWLDMPRELEKWLSEYELYLDADENRPDFPEDFGKGVVLPYSPKPSPNSTHAHQISPFDY